MPPIGLCQNQYLFQSRSIVRLSKSLTLPPTQSGNIFPISRQNLPTRSVRAAISAASSPGRDRPQGIREGRLCPDQDPHPGWWLPWLQDCQRGERYRRCRSKLTRAPGIRHAVGRDREVSKEGAASNRRIVHPRPGPKPGVSRQEAEGIGEGKEGSEAPADGCPAGCGGSGTLPPQTDRGRRQAGAPFPEDGKLY